MAKQSEIDKAIHGLDERIHALQMAKEALENARREKPRAKKPGSKPTAVPDKQQLG